MRQARRIGDDAVAHAERALGRLDQAVHVIEALRLGDAQPLDTARGSSARRAPASAAACCRRVPTLSLHAQRLGDSTAR